MSDERTASKFTWLNAPLCGRQDVENIIDMVQIGQWYAQNNVRFFCSESFRTWLINIYHPFLDIKEQPKRNLYRPVVKFRNIDAGVLECVQKGEKSGIPSDGSESSDSESDNGEMDEPQAEALHSFSRAKAKQVAFEVDCDIDITSPWLLDLLSDSPSVSDTEKTVSSAPHAMDNTGEIDLDAIFADWQWKTAFLHVLIVIYMKNMIEHYLAWNAWFFGGSH